jgi:hypothetical protein
MGRTLGVMFTATTYGQWLRGDRRGWVDAGRILPADPAMEDRDRRRLRHDPYLLPADRLVDVGQSMVDALRDRLGLVVLALTVQTWHVHVTVGGSRHRPGTVVKCFTDAARWRLRPGRPIWAEGCDKRFCFDSATLHRRVDYVRKHNRRNGLGDNPYRGVTSIDDYLARRTYPVSPG